MYEKIYSHPDKDDIIKMLLNGVSVKKVEQFLKDKYPNNKKFHITFVTLQNFRLNNLDLEKAAIEEIRIDIAQKDPVTSSPEYVKKLGEVKTLHVDLPSKISNIIGLMESRAEQYFNKTSSSDLNDRTIRQDRMMLDYFKQIIESIKDLKEINDELSANQNQDGINLQIMNEHIKILRNAMFNSINKFDPDIAMQFMEDVSNQIASKTLESSTTKNIYEKVEVLDTLMTKLDNNED